MSYLCSSGSIPATCHPHKRAARFPLWSCTQPLPSFLVYEPSPLVALVASDNQTLHRNIEHWNFELMASSCRKIAKPVQQFLFDCLWGDGELDQEDLRAFKCELLILLGNCYLGIWERTFSSPPRPDPRCESRLGDPGMCRPASLSESRCRWFWPETTSSTEKLCGIRCFSLERWHTKTKPF